MFFPPQNKDYSEWPQQTRFFPYGAEARRYIARLSQLSSQPSSFHRPDSLRSGSCVTGFCDGAGKNASDAEEKISAKMSLFKVKISTKYGSIPIWHLRFNNKMISSRERISDWA
jgi:hypothetical protein